MRELTYRVQVFKVSIISLLYLSPIWFYSVKCRMTLPFIIAFSCLSITGIQLIGIQVPDWEKEGGSKRGNIGEVRGKG